MARSDADRAAISRRDRRDPAASRPATVSRQRRDRRARPLPPPVSGQATLDAVELFVALIATGAIVSLLARRFAALPDSVALVLLGLLITAFAPLERFTITPELVLVVLVPGLVFEAAYRLDLDEVRRTFLGAVVLAVPGVIVSAGVIAVILTVVVGLAPSQAFVVGAIVSATD